MLILLVAIEVHILKCISENGPYLLFDNQYFVNSLKMLIEWIESNISFFVCVLLYEKVSFAGTLEIYLK